MSNLPEFLTDSELEGTLKLAMGNGECEGAKRSDSIPPTKLTNNPVPRTAHRLTAISTPPMQISRALDTSSLKYGFILFHSQEQRDGFIEEFDGKEVSGC